MSGQLAVEVSDLSGSERMLQAIFEGNLDPALVACSIRSLLLVVLQCRFLHRFQPPNSAIHRILSATHCIQTLSWEKLA